MDQCTRLTRLGNAKQKSGRLYGVIAAWLRRGHAEREYLYLSAGISDFTTVWQVRATHVCGFC